MLTPIGQEHLDFQRAVLNPRRQILDRHCRQGRFTKFAARDITRLGEIAYFQTCDVADVDQSALGAVGPEVPIGAVYKSDEGRFVDQPLLSGQSHASRINFSSASPATACPNR